MRADYSDSALVLLGHGTTLNPYSAAPVYQHAAELRRRKCFAEVREAFWKQDPSLVQVLAEITAASAFIVPLFISEGHFSEEVIPRELGFRGPGPGEWSRALRRGEQVLTYCKPIGTHSRMTEVVLARAREVVKSFPFPRAPQEEDTTLLIAGHGTERNENSRKAIEQQVESIRAMGMYQAVHAIFMEEEPRIAACYELAPSRNLVIVPLFISDGLHTQEDIPILLGESERLVRQRLRSRKPTWRNPTAKKGKLVWYSSSVGSDRSIEEVILARVEESASLRNC